jgi:hypothetical protein
MDRTQWFTVVVSSLSPSRSSSTRYVSKVNYKTTTFPQYFIDQLMDSPLKCQVRFAE